jgi:sugar lactone lactonase YvrE
MKHRWIVLPLLLLLVAATAGVARSVQAKGPTSGAQLAADLRSPINARIGPDGMIYVAESGSGGPTDFTGADGTVYHNGLTGRISKIDPDTGARTTVLDNLPSNGGAEAASGPMDVAFLNGSMYYLQTHGGAAYGFPGTPTGIYKISGGAATLVADIGAFNLANPVDDVANHVQFDIEAGGNPFAMITRDGAFLVTDGNQNQIMKVTETGTVTRLMQFHDHPVSTAITYKGSGPLYTTTLGKFPFKDDDGILWKVDYPAGTATQVAHGAGSLTGAAYGPNGQLYVLAIGRQATTLAPNLPPWNFGSGRILRVEADGTLTPMVDGLMFPTSLVFDGNTAYVTGLLGDLTKIGGFSSLQPLPPTPVPAATATPAAPPPPAATATSTGVIGVPDTGSGPDGPDSGTLLWKIALAAAVGGVACTGIAVRRAGR